MDRKIGENRQTAESSSSVFLSRKARRAVNVDLSA